MLYANHKGGVSTNPDGQRALVYLVSDVEQVANSPCRWVFTDGHAVMSYTRFMNSLDDLETLDWEAIHAEVWIDTDEYPDRRRLKQAEFLVHRTFPTPLLTEIAVLDSNVAQRVQEILTEANVNLPIEVRPNWYY